LPQPTNQTPNVSIECRSKEASEAIYPALLPARLQRIAHLLACPDCESDLQQQGKGFDCQTCGKVYPVRAGKIYFIEPLCAQDALDFIKDRLKRFLGSLYYTIGVNVLSPSYPFNYKAAICKHVNASDRVVVDLGCGNHRVHDEFITLDATDYPAVDIVARLEALPFKSESLDALCSRSVLEHVTDLDGSIAEIQRCTRSDGLSIHFVPFMYPFHASPYDFRRWTHVGAGEMLRGWYVIEQRATEGPVSLFLICFLEFISALLSFGNARLKAVVYLLFCLVVFPIKFLDAPFVGRKRFLGMAPTILTVFRKPSAAPDRAC
jgi:SAM-dependent methyltransferase